MTGNASHALRSDCSRMSSDEKLLDWHELLARRAGWREERRAVVWTNGCFDLLHPGHVASLEAARSLGDILVVGLNSDDSVRRLKGPGRPVFDEGERARLIGALEAVDAVVVFEEDTPIAALEKLRPD